MCTSLRIAAAATIATFVAIQVSKRMQKYQRKKLLRDIKCRDPPALTDILKLKALAVMRPKLQCVPFLQKARQGALLVDVRSPQEFRSGHIPGATSIPLLSDGERAQVGTLYKEKGAHDAMILGMNIVRPKLNDIVQQVVTAMQSQNTLSVCVYCWRGGMRSSSVAWLLEMHGISVSTLCGGYKSFRSWALGYWGDVALPPRFPKKTKTSKKGEANARKAHTSHSSESVALAGLSNGEHELPNSIVEAAQSLPGPRICVIGGRTGVGKTKILHALRRLGADVVDLEGMANHRGSAFGWVGDGNLGQPTNEQFQNALAVEWHRLAMTSKGDSHRGWLFLEDEDDHIGSCHLPPAVYAGLRCAPLVMRIVLHKEERIRLLVSDYALGHADGHDAVYWLERMESSVGRLAKRLGGVRVKELHETLRVGDYTNVARLLLEYYDGLYDKHLRNAGGTGSGSGSRCGILVDVDPGDSFAFDADRFARLVLEKVQDFDNNVRFP